MKKMKDNKNKSLIILLLLFISCMASAQVTKDYEPFIVEGKVWYYENRGFNNSYYVYKVYFEGDTVIDGIKLKRLVEERPGYPAYSPCACYENEGKVWVYYSKYSNRPWTKWLLFDFNCKEGDTVTDLFLYGPEQFMVEKIDIIPSFGRDRHRITITQEENNRRPASAYWLEGIGSRFNMFSLWPNGTGATERFYYCELNGEIIADQSSFGDAALQLSGIQEITTSLSQPPALYDLQGRRRRAEVSSEIGTFPDHSKHMTVPHYML